MVTRNTIGNRTGTRVASAFGQIFVKRSTFFKSLIVASALIGSVKADAVSDVYGDTATIKQDVDSGWYQSTRLYNKSDTKWVYNGKAILQLVLVGGSGPQYVRVQAKLAKLKIITGVNPYNPSQFTYRIVHGKGKARRYYVKNFTFPGAGTYYINIPLKSNWNSHVIVTTHGNTGLTDRYVNNIGWDQRNGIKSKIQN